MVETTIVPGPKALLETEHVLAGGFFGRIASATPLKDFLHHCKALLQKIPERDQLLDAEIRRQVEGLERNGRAHGGPVLLLRGWLHIHARTGDGLLKALEQTMTMTTTMAKAMTTVTMVITTTRTRCIIGGWIMAAYVQASAQSKTTETSASIVIHSHMAHFRPRRDRAHAAAMASTTQRCFQQRLPHLAARAHILKEEFL